MVKISIKRVLLTSVIAVTITSVCLCWYVAGLLVYQPMQFTEKFCAPAPDPCLESKLAEYHLAAKEIRVELQAFDGVKLTGSYFPSRNGAAVIVQHGYSGHRGKVMHIVAMLEKHGYGVIAMDMRVHGESGGTAVTFGRDESRDMFSAFNYLKNRLDVSADKIGVYGWSLGASTAMIHGDLNDEIRAVVADSPFDAVNYGNMAEFTDFIWPLPALLTYFTSYRSGVDFEADSPIAHLQAYKHKPLFLLLAGADRIADPDSGQRLLAHLDVAQVKVWHAPLMEHVGFSIDEAQRFEQEVTDFYARHLHPFDGITMD
jgi:alpha-beta hydrolase superfamily lysophospholipase